MMQDIFKKPEATGWHVIWMYVLFLMILWKLSTIQNSLDNIFRNSCQTIYILEKKAEK